MSLEHSALPQEKTSDSPSYMESKGRDAEKSAGNTPLPPRTQFGWHGTDDDRGGLSELNIDSQEIPNAVASDALKILEPSSRYVGKELLATWQSELETLMVFGGLLSAAVIIFANDFSANPFWALSFVLSLATALFSLSVRQWLSTVPDLQRLPAHTAAILQQMSNVVCALVVLLQAAVVLFLAGLLALLQEFHSTILLKLLVAGGVAFLLYSFATRVPRLWPTCLSTHL